MTQNPLLHQKKFKTIKKCNFKNDYIFDLKYNFFHVSGHSESAVEKVETAFSLRPLDSRTFVIKRSSNKASSSTASSPAVSFYKLLQNLILIIYF